MVSHFLATFGSHKYCDSGDIMLLVIEVHMSSLRHYCLSLKHMACLANAQKTSGVSKTPYLDHTRTTGSKNYLKKLPVRPK